MDFFSTTTNTVGVNCIIKDSYNNTYIGGDFQSVGGPTDTPLTVYSIARYDVDGIWYNISTDDSILETIIINTMIIDSSNNLYIGCTQSATIGLIYKYNLTSGIAWSLFANTNGSIYTLNLDNAQHLYIGGTFTTVNGTNGYNNVAKWDGTTWSNMNSGLTYNGGGNIPIVKTLSFDNNGILYAGGNFNRPNGISNIAKYVSGAWTNVGTGTSGATNDIVNVIIFDSSNDAYIGGHFTKAGGINAHSIVKYNTTNSTWSLLDNGIRDNSNQPGHVYSLCLDLGGIIYAGGTFTNNGTCNNIAYYDIALAKWISLSSGILSAGIPTVKTLFNNYNIIYLGGYFDATRDYLNNNYLLGNLGIYTPTYKTIGLNSYDTIHFNNGSSSINDIDLYTYLIPILPNIRYNVYPNLTVKFKTYIREYYVLYTTNNATISWDLIKNIFNNIDPTFSYTGKDIIFFVYSSAQTNTIDIGTGITPSYYYFPMNNNDIINITIDGITYNGLSYTNTPQEKITYNSTVYSLGQTIHLGGISNHTIDLLGFGSVGSQIHCFTSDTRILTPDGYKIVINLKEGDNVLTDDNRKSRIMRITKILENRMFPYIIEKDSIEENYPSETIKLSKKHKIKYQNRWLYPDMIKNASIDNKTQYIVYYHIELENYVTDNLVVNGGTVIESLTSIGHNKRRDMNEDIRRQKSIIIDIENNN